MEASKVIALHSPTCATCHLGFTAGQRFFAVGTPWNCLVHEHCLGSTLVNTLLLSKPPD